MKGKTKYLMLDRTLEHLSGIKDKKDITTSSLSKEFETDYHVMHNVVQNLSDKGYVQGKELHPANPDFQGDVSITLTPDGRYFFSVDGGFANLYKKERLDHTWKIVSIIASIVNALALLMLSFLALND
ncbi:MAG TPA: hypothetical protein VMZ69_06720 [Saprospiraceae bacterium]|nr:hypothetical protein [Saprospiraceae bacterium]